MNGPVGIHFDRLAVCLAEVACRKLIEPRLNNLPVWDGGLGAIVETAVRENGIRSEAFTVIDFARAVGMLRPVKRSSATGGGG